VPKALVPRGPRTRRRGQRGRAALARLPDRPEASGPHVCGS
jgi:hypothetical protein